MDFNLINCLILSSFTSVGYYACRGDYGRAWYFFALASVAMFVTWFINH